MFKEVERLWPFFPTPERSDILPLLRMTRMSKRGSAKRQHYEVAKFCGPITNKNEIRKREKNENHTSTNEKPRDADS
jgi:hypothetical protein